MEDGWSFLTALECDQEVLILWNGYKENVVDCTLLHWSKPSSMGRIELRPDDDRVYQIDDRPNDMVSK
jgi:hypothetical protein